MIIQDDTELVLGNKAENRKFQIASSKKAFKILSSGLYKNKIRAVVRELSCNCTDAHKLNGYKGAFDIKVPGSMDPRFVIRDYGPGLSKDGLENLYTTYFASTKTGSNDFIGALGLGSKSPFAYTDTFTVVSYHEGMAYGYTAMLDQGEPVIRPIFTEKMGPNDKTGLEITVPVKTGDIERWKSEIAYVIRPFGEDKVNLIDSKLEPEYFPEFDEYFTRNYNHNAPESSGMYAVYGSIVYPLDDVPGLGNTWLMSRYNTVFVRFPLGELDIAASREELSLDEQTIENIINRVKDLDRRVMEDDIKEWVESTHERQVLRDITNLNHTARNIIDQRGIKFTPKQLTYDQLFKKYKVDPVFQHAGVVYEVYIDPKMRRLKHGTSGQGINVALLLGNSTKKLTIIIDDYKKGRLNAIRALNDMYHPTTNEAVKKVIAENPWLPKRGEQLLFVNPESQMEMDLLPEILRLMGDDEVKMIYTTEMHDLVEPFIPKREATAYIPKPKAPSAVRHFKHKDGYWTTENLFMTAVDAEELEGPVVFIHGHHYKFMNAALGDVYNLSMSNLQHLADIMGITEFHSARSTLHKKIIKMGQCTDILVDVFEKYIELIDEVDYDMYMGVSSRANKYTRHIYSHPELAPLIKWFNTSGEVSEEAKTLNAVRCYLSSVSVISNDDKTYSDAYLKCGKITYELGQFASERATELVAKFEKANIVVSNFLSNNHTLDEAELKEIVKLMGL